jgi:MoxR-like ATPase
MNDVSVKSGARAGFLRLRQYLSSQIIGQEVLVERLLVALLADGHMLVEGPPGLAKTRAVKALAHAVEGDFQRIQFTPDMLPADLTGSEIYRPEEGSFRFQRGPLFHHLILADEINRAPAKVQSALLEAMAERQISVGQATYPLPQLFFVMATQNPIEQEGTYPLPEAQIDRFMLHVEVDYPDRATTLKIMGLARNEAITQRELPPPAQRLSQEVIFAARREVLSLTFTDPVAEYIAALVEATRRPEPYSA